MSHGGLENAESTQGEDNLCNDSVFVRNDIDKNKGTRFSLMQAFACAGSGFSYAFLSQRNMKIHAGVAFIALLAGFILHLSPAEWAAVIVCVGMVFAAECLNTAIESVVDLVSPEYALLARRTKDCAAAAVLVCAVVSVGVALVVFIPHIACMFV